MNYAQATDFLFNSFPSYQNIGSQAYKEGLQGITEMCRLLGNPQRNYFTIHVAGTNGKGSVSHMLASVLQQAGYCVGLFTSPHLLDFRERIRINGECISEKEVVRFTQEHKQEMVALGLSFFEMTTAMAFDHFAAGDVEVAVIETGLGGRLDSTNIITPTLSVITNIGLDHTSMLGNTIAEIAFEKAGIIKPEVPVVVGESAAESDEVFCRTAEMCGSKLVFADREWAVVESEPSAECVRYTLQRERDGRTQILDLDLLGDYQRKNILTVRTAVSLLRNETHLNISTRALVEGLRGVAESTGLTGRWHKLHDAPLAVCDTGHNAHGLAEVVAQIARQSYEKLFVVFGVVSDKDVEAIVPLMPTDAYYIFTQSSVRRAMAAEELAEVFVREGFRGEVVPGVAEAYKRALSLASADDMIFVGGSTFVVADLLAQE
ncbi:MAG: bifunctional folylpolyglutamate synthase/dihydrofolate synthase [Tidjanibacter sp.]|nr:bifunctional folylpolyglutamate synthase/dihydrofolate synthase [Tidjanibacter sp.]